MLEKSFQAYIPQYLAQQTVLFPAQHGFVKNRSPPNKLFSFCNYLTERLIEGNQVEVRYLDF